MLESCAMHVQPQWVQLKTFYKIFLIKCFGLQLKSKSFLNDCETGSNDFIEIISINLETY